MAFQVPNHTQTPNELFDDHMRYMSGSELKVILAICRKTFGWHKEQDNISLSQLMELTGLTRSSVINAIKSLIARGLIARRKIGNSYEYALILSASIKIIPAGSIKIIPASKGSGGIKTIHTKEKKRNTLLIKEIKNYLDDPFANWIED